MIPFIPGEGININIGPSLLGTLKKSPKKTIKYLSIKESKTCNVIETEFNKNWSLHAILRFARMVYGVKQIRSSLCMGLSSPVLIDGNRVVSANTTLEYLHRSYYFWSNYDDANYILINLREGLAYLSHLKKYSNNPIDSLFISVSNTYVSSTMTDFLEYISQSRQV